MRLHISELNLSGLQPHGTRHRRLPKASLDMSEWLYEGQRGFRPGCSCENQIAIVCQDVADPLDGSRIDAIVIDFSKALYLVPCDRMLTKIATLGVSRVVVWVRELF